MSLKHLPLKFIWLTPTKLLIEPMTKNMTIPEVSQNGGHPHWLRMQLEAKGYEPVEIVVRTQEARKECE